MSMITWNVEASTVPLISSNALNVIARRVGVGVGLVMATGTAYAALFLAALMATSIIQF